MNRQARIVLAASVLIISALPARAECNISDAKLEEAILQKPELRDGANRQMVRDLRALRDSAFILWSYARHDDCERVLASIRDLIASPSMGNLGDNDEDEADQQLAAREPMLERGGAVIGRREDADAKPLIDIDELGPGLRADEILGAEVRSSDDKIIGEVRNVVIGTKDREDYVVVASGGFFTVGKDSIVVPLRSLQISQGRESFYLRIPEREMRDVPLMPDQDYSWLSDAKPPFGGPKQVLAYPGRYAHRVAIANSRLIIMADRKVELRCGDYRQRCKSRVVCLTPTSSSGVLCCTPCRMASIVCAINSSSTAIVDHRLPRDQSSWSSIAACHCGRNSAKSRSRYPVFNDFVLCLFFAVALSAAQPGRNISCQQLLLRQ
ncbi:hypothetical protein GA830_19650 (plasmid) [Mesorhizobium sp. NBSH29]|nr:hypothetical protein GA830_19650 [Mesorhizobium sp. NBSH29]